MKTLHSQVSLPDFSAALLSHFFLRTSIALSSSHQASSKAFLHAIIHTHVLFLKSFTIEAVIIVYLVI